MQNPVRPNKLFADAVDTKQDRPDILAIYTICIEADKSKYPILLSNGNLIAEGPLEGFKDSKHYAIWVDPFKKPCYLFAVIAGQLEFRADTFITRSGREVALNIRTLSEDLPKTAHAMYSLKAAMKWDEDVLGLEYDLDIFNIVAVPDFNMGAMENKSLNIFNSKLVLASPEIATDVDYAVILGVIVHKYFHNWTGNRSRGSLLWRSFFSTVIVAIMLRGFLDFFYKGNCGLFGTGGLIMYNVTSKDFVYHLSNVPVVVLIMYNVTSDKEVLYFILFVGCILLY